MKVVTKLGLSTVVVAIITGLSLGIMIYTGGAKVLQDRLVEGQHVIANRLIYSVDQQLFLAQRDLKMLVEDEFLQIYLGEPEKRREESRLLLENELDERVELTGPWDTLAVVDLHGEHLFIPGSKSQLQQIDHYPESKKAFLSALDGKAYISDWVVSDYSGQPTMILAAPINGEEEGEVVGVIIAHYHWGAINKTLTTLVAQDVAHLINRQGEVISFKAHGAGHHSHGSFAQHPLLSQPPDSRGFNFGTYETVDGEGKSFAVSVMEPGYESYPGKGWRLILEMPEGLVFDPASRMSLRVGIVTFAAFSLLTLLLITITRKTIGPLADLTNRVKLIGEGDYEQHIEIPQSDEIGQLASSFNQMAANLKEHRLELTRAEARYHELVDEIDDGIIALDAAGVITFVNRPFLRMLGHSDDAEVLGQPFTSFVIVEQQQALHALLMQDGTTHSANQGFETVLARPDGNPIFVQLRHVPIVDDQGLISGYRAVVRDITKQKETEQHILFRASHDSLTGLPNRDMMLETLDLSLAQGKRHGGELAVLFIDLDEFKLVNDTLGHDAGDELLFEVGGRLKSTLRASDLLARHGGDEFILVATNRCDASQHDDFEDIICQHAATVAQRILELLEEPFVLRGQDVYVGASIGISTFPTDGDDSTNLLQYADSAMYQAKELGRNTYKFYSKELSERQEKRVFLANRLHKAVEGSEFILYYQPVIELSSGTMVGVEALIRWVSEGKIIPPDVFIPVAEATGMILPIGDWVLWETCRQLREWENKGIDLFIAANVSVKQLWKGDITSKLLERVETFGVNKQRLELEITESAMTVDATRMEVVMDDFKAHGLAISLDDFGTGYSSLDRLKHLPINKLKIDRSFVDGIPQDLDDMAIVTAVIQMASNLGIDSLAEGIETEAQWAFLREQGCQYGQGYYFSQPVPVEEIEVMWYEWKKTGVPGIQPPAILGEEA